MSGADVPEAVRQRLREAAGGRCGYCFSPQRLVMGHLEIEHLIPRARGGCGSAGAEAPGMKLAL